MKATMAKAMMSAAAMSAMSTMSVVSVAAAMTAALTASGCGFGARTCAAQNDCPEGEGCSADGVCVAMRHRDSLVARYGDVPGGSGTGGAGTVGGGGDGGGGVIVAGGGGGAAIPFTGDPIFGVANGNIGPLVLTRDSVIQLDPDVSAGMWMYTDPGPAGGELGLAIIAPSSVTMDDMLCNPGTYRADADSLDGDVYAQACTLNENSNQSHYDEPVDSSIDVGERDPETGFVPLAIHQSSAQTTFDATVAVPAHCAQ